MCIGRFSAVSFQVLGHMKTICVLILGWVLFESVLTGKNLTGMGLAVVGMLGYSWAVEADKQKNSKVSPLLPVKSKFVGEEETKLLLRVKTSGGNQGQSKS